MPHAEQERLRPERSFVDASVLDASLAAGGGAAAGVGGHYSVGADGSDGQIVTSW